jgi:aminocarboxymuconate-semialdehyde decarboxylase
VKIDVHCHQIEGIFFDALRSLPGVTVRVNPDRFSYLLKDGKTWLPFRPEMFHPDHLIREMDRKGIDMSVLSMNTPSVFIFEKGLRADLARRLNDALVARAKRNPDRVRGFATLPLPDVEDALIELERIADAPGIVGIGVGSNFDGVALDDERLEPLWARISKLGLPLYEHPMLPSFAEHLPGYALPIRVGFPFDTSLCVTRMIYGGVFERHPGLKFIAAHTGSAFIGLLERLDHGFQLFHECSEHITQPPSAFARKNLYYDTCVFSKSFLEMAAVEVGVDRLLFGTDYPYIVSGPSYIEALELPEDQKQMIFSGNATRLFGTRLAMNSASQLA